MDIADIVVLVSTSISKALVAVGDAVLLQLLPVAKWPLDTSQVQ